MMSQENPTTIRQQLGQLTGSPLFKRILYFLGAILVAVVLYFVYLAIPKQNDRLFKANFEPYPAPVYTADPQKKKDKLAIAFEAYAKKNYAKAIHHFGITNEKVDGFPVLFYKANAYLAEGESLFALGILEQLQATADSKTKAEVNWYLALAYLQNGQAKRAQDLLKELSKQSAQGFKKIEADLLLEKLQDE